MSWVSSELEFASQLAKNHIDKCASYADETLAAVTGLFPDRFAVTPKPLQDAQITYPGDKCSINDARYCNKKTELPLVQDFRQRPLQISPVVPQPAGQSIKRSCPSPTRYPTSKRTALKASPVRIPPSMTSNSSDDTHNRQPKHPTSAGALPNRPPGSHELAPQLISVKSFISPRGSPLKSPRLPLRELRNVSPPTGSPGKHVRTNTSKKIPLTNGRPYDMKGLSGQSINQAGRSLEVGNKTQVARHMLPTQASTNRSVYNVCTSNPPSPLTRRQVDRNAINLSKGMFSTGIQPSAVPQIAVTKVKAQSRCTEKLHHASGTVAGSGTLREATKSVTLPDGRQTTDLGKDIGLPMKANANDSSSSIKSLSSAEKNNASALSPNTLPKTLDATSHDFFSTRADRDSAVNLFSKSNAVHVAHTDFVKQSSANNNEANSKDILMSRDYPAQPVHNSLVRPPNTGGIRIMGSPNVSVTRIRVDSPAQVTLPEISDCDGTSILQEWARTPEVCKQIESQLQMDPTSVFGPIAPIDMSQIFNKRRLRPRTSSAIWDHDGLSIKEREDYAQKMGFDREKS